MKAETATGTISVCAGFTSRTRHVWKWYLVYLVFLSAVAVAEESSSHAKALAAYQERHLEEAFRYAKQATHENPDHPDAHALLGELYYLRQELTRAQESWEKALKLAPSRKDIRDRLAKLKSELQVEKNLTRSDTYPFVVRFAEGEIPVDLGGLRLLLRDTHRLVGQQLDYFPDHSIAVILYPAADFEKVKGVSHQAAGLYDGKIRLPLNPNQPRPSQELQAVLWHEYTHALVHDLSKGRCPVWLNEGIAELQEARVRTVQLTQAREAFLRGQSIPWEKFWQQAYEGSSLELAYQQAYLIAQFLVKRWGWGKLTELLKHLGQGYPLADAFKAVYKVDAAVLEKEWLTWARGQVLQ